MKRLLTLWLLLATVATGLTGPAQATVSTTAPRNDYVGNNSTATYSYTFKIFAATDLRVTTRDTSNVETTLTYPTDYTVTGVGSTSGGTITLTAGNLATDYALTIRFDRTPRQSTDLRNQGNFFPETHEEKFDELTRYAQQLEDAADRSLHLPETEAGSAAATTLPVAEDRASKYLAFDASGNPVVSAGGFSTPVVTAFMETVLDDTTAAAARTTLGVPSTAESNEQGDNVFRITGSADATKKLAFEVDGLTTATTRTVTPADYNIRLGNLPAGIGCLPYAGSSIPTGWLECDGSAVSRTTYAALFTAISTTWGSGDGSTTFNVPDMRGRVPIGAGTGTVTASGTNGDVDTAADTLTVASNNTKWITGQAVTFTLTSGTITGLTSGNTYYVIRASSTTVKLASSLALAQAGTAVDMTAKSSPVWTITHTYTARTLGESGGEETHAMSSTELLAHTHDTVAVPTGGGLAAGGFQATASGSTGSTGGNAAMNTMQPFATMKFIISY